MEPLSPRSANIKIKPLKKDGLEAKAAGTRKTQREKEHASPPPAYVQEPSQSDGTSGLSYRTGDLLGKGGFAICYSGELLDQALKPSGRVFALKIVKSNMTQKKMEEKFRTELQIHSKMHHPNIVEFHRAFAHEQNTYVVLELCSNKSLMEMVKYRKFLTLPEVRRYTIQMCGAIKYMHSRDVIHRDLKMGNIFLDSEMNIKIGDFGLAAILLGAKDASHIRRTTMCGTPNYIAPEILEKSKQGHDHNVDIWSLGVIIFAMLTGTPPFQSKSQEEIYRRVKAREYDWPSPEQCSNVITKSAKDLVASILVAADNRPSPDQIASHTFFSDGHVPNSLNTACLKDAPRWADDQVVDRPSKTVSDTWRRQCADLCRRCGVGIMSSGNPYPLTSQNSRTIFAECKEEQLLGKTPVVPMPADMIYTPLISSISLETRGGEHDEASDARSILRAQRLRKQEEILPENIALPSSSSPPIEQRLPLHSSTTTTVKSHAATLRDQNRVVSTSRSNRQPAGAQQSQESSNSKAFSGSVKGLLSEGAQRRGGKEYLAPVGVVDQSSQTSKSRSVSDSSNRGMLRNGPRRAALPSFASTRELRSSAKEIPGTSDNAASGLTRARSQRAITDVQSTVRERPSRKRAEATEEVRVPGPSAENARRVALPTTNSKDTQTGGLLIRPEENSETVAGTDSRSILKSLRAFSNNVESALENSDSDPLRHERPSGHDIVVKWVDYTNKFGIGYILSDGTIGCLFNQDDKNPSTAIVVRNGERHVQSKDAATYAERHQIVPIHGGRPIEFFENRGRQGLERALVAPEEFKIRAVKGSIADKLGPGRDRVDSHRRKTVQLWRNFANYMVHILGNSDDESTVNVTETLRDLNLDRSSPFLKFYQRFGDVGVFGFGDGSFQFNFPDHTKIVISHDGNYCHFYCLPLEAYEYLKYGGEIPSSLLEKRGYISGPTSILLHEDQHGSIKNMRETMRRNQFQVKIEFINYVVMAWIQGRGLGCVKEEKLRYEGPKETKLAGKSSDKKVWVTIGALGGDLERVTESTESSRNVRDMA